MKNTKQERKPEEKPFISNLNCYTKPYQSLDFISVKDGNVTNFAYVWYATDFDYFCSALVAMKQMQNLRIGSNLNVDYIMLFSKTEKIGKSLLDLWISEGGVIKEYESLGKEYKLKKYVHVIIV